MTGTGPTTDVPRRSLRHRLYHGETSFDYVRRKRIWFAISGLVIGIGLVSLLAQGLNYGIDFKGGTSWEVRAPGVSVAEARDALRPAGLGDAKIQIQGADLLRVQHDRRDDSEGQAEVTEAVAKLGGVAPAQVSVNDVGPSWGKAVTKKARNALIVFFVLITLYITLRFEWKMAVAAIAAVVHDILVTVGVYSLSRFEVTPATVVAFLTILGYSLYDTIVVFDKVEENARGLSTQRRMTYTDTVNLSMNQVLMRSINTSLVAILPILSVLVVGAGILGATTLKDFGLALLVGLLTGAYSSIFIASPILAMIKEREPQYTGIRHRVESKGGSTILTPAAAAAAAGGGPAPARPAGGGGGSRSRKRPGGDRDEDEDLLAPAAADTPAPRPRPSASSRPKSGGGGGGGSRPAPRPRKKKGKRR
ncbi:MAG: protein translocase subunit SecF [Acidimicrobiales bacterium]